MKIINLFITFLMITTMPAFLKTNTETNKEQANSQAFKLKTDIKKMEKTDKSEKTEKSEKSEVTEKKVQVQAESQKISIHKYYYADPEQINHLNGNTQNFGFADKSNILDKIEMQKGLAAADIGF